MVKMKTKSIKKRLRTLKSSKGAFFARVIPNDFGYKVLLTRFTTKSLLKGLQQHPKDRQKAEATNRELVSTCYPSIRWRFVPQRHLSFSSLVFPWVSDGQSPTAVVPDIRYNVSFAASSIYGCDDRYSLLLPSAGCWSAFSSVWRCSPLLGLDFLVWW